MSNYALEKNARITVVCEYHLRNDCSDTTCPAYRENEITLVGTEILKTGCIYYTYSCAKLGKEVKLLDILFGLKSNPNILFKNRKHKKQTTAF
jgi:hypothetical protein